MAFEQQMQEFKELGSKLENPPASRDALVELLNQGATLLSKLDQSPPESLLKSMEPFLHAIAKPELMKHQDREVKLSVAVCITEVSRITAPDGPYEEALWKDIFRLIVSTFNGLSDINSPSFGKTLFILETLAKYRTCVVMLDLECEDIIENMFNTFFAVARDEHPENVLTSMQTIMEVLLDDCEDAETFLFLNLFSGLGHSKEELTMAARKLAMNVIEHCAGKLEPAIKQFIQSLMSGESRSLKHEIDYHGVLSGIYCCAPHVLSGIVPYLTGELLSDQLEIRLKAVGLVGDLFAAPGSTISEVFQPVFVEFLNRLTDSVADIRMSAIEHVKFFLLANPIRTEAPQVIDLLCDRLLDDDENVRKHVVSVVCDVACHALTAIPVKTIKLVSECLRDESLLVKRYTMERLADVYKVACMDQYSISTKTAEYDWIVGKILRCFNDKDFRSETIEPILYLSLFPADFLVKDKVTNWIRIFSGFDKVEVKTFEKILEQKQRLQQEMQKYLSLRQLSQEADGTEIQNKSMFCFRVMSHCFTNPVEAEQNFQILDQIKDSKLWNSFAQLLDPNTSFLQASSSVDDLINILGKNHQLYEFVRALSLKCSYLLFGKDHAREILLEAREHKSSGSDDLLLSCMTLLAILARFCTSLLAGVIEDLITLLDADNEIIKEGVLHILAKSGEAIRELGVSSSLLGLILRLICIEGSRRQAKYAVHALAAITKDDGLMSLSVLYKRLVRMLEKKSHLPAVLQSLGCIAQAARPVFETRENDVKKFIKENILEQKHVTRNKETDRWGDRSELCSLKIFGIKVLVKSYLPVKDAPLHSGIDDLIKILKNILSLGQISGETNASLVDRAHLKLAAAKAVLRLSKHWEYKFATDIFYLVLRTSDDSFPEVRKLLLEKIQQYVKDRNLDAKYACALLLDLSPQQSNLEKNKHNLNDIIQMCRQGDGCQILSSPDANPALIHPEHMLPYVVHSLAHHPSFPDIDECSDVKRFEPMYRQLYFFLSMLVHGGADSKSGVDTSKDKEAISLLSSIFLCITQSEDAFDAAKSKNSYALCDFGMSIIRQLAPAQDDFQDSRSVVAIPPELYKPLEHKEEDDLLVNSVFTGHDIMDSETEASELPLRKVMERLKAKRAKAKIKVNSKSAPIGVANKFNFDFSKMVKEINSDDRGPTSKTGSSYGHGEVHKKKRDLNKDILTDFPVPKRRRSSARDHKSLPAVTSTGDNRPADSNQESINVESDKMDEVRRTSSEDQYVLKNIAEPADSDLLVSCIRKKHNSSPKQKGPTSRTESSYYHDEAHKKRSDHNENLLFSVSTDFPVPIRRRSSVRGHKSLPAVTSCIRKRYNSSPKLKGSTSRTESSNSHDEAHKKKSDHNKNLLFSGSTDFPVPKRRRSSVRGHKSLPAVTSAGANRPSDVNQESTVVELDQMDEERQTSSEDQNVLENIAEPADSDLLASYISKKLNFSLKKKGKCPDKYRAEALHQSPDTKLKEIAEIESTNAITSSKSGSMNNEKQKSTAELRKCTKKDKESLGAGLIGCKIRVWWPKDKRFYEGVVKSFDTQKKKYKILYDDGGKEFLKLEKQRWEFVGNEERAEKQSGSSKSSHPRARRKTR